MALPRQAREQVENANRILEELQKHRQGAEEPAVVVKDEVPPEEPEQPEQPEEPEQPEQPEEPEQPEQPEEPEQPEQPEEPEQPTSRVEQPEDFEHKYKVLQGKYNNEVPRLNRQVADLTDQLERMQATLAELQAKREEPEQVETTQLVTQEEIDEFGPDLVDLIARKARELYEPTVNSLKSEISALKSQVGGVSQEVHMTARDRLLAKLDDEVKNWRQVNQDEEFLAWLDQVDPYSGQVRGKMLKQAYERNDAPRVVAFFNGFLDEHATVTSSQEQPGSEPAPPPERKPAVDLNEQVAPGKRRKPSGNGAQKEKRIWTKQQIAAFYADVQKGKFKGREDEKRALEQDIFSATAEGRIR